MSKKEEECTIMARVGDFNGFKEADSCVNIQELVCFVEGKGKFRQRCNVDNNGKTYTTNVKHLGKPVAAGGAVKAAEDVDIPSNAAYFEAARTLSESLTVRDRFTFNGSVATFVKDGKEVTIPPLKYEVDVFQRFDGHQSPWVKIDIEVGTLLDAVRTMGLNPEGLDLDIKISHLPFKPQEAFIVSDSNTPEEKQKIKNFWDEHKQSPFGGPFEEVQPSIAPARQPEGQPVNQPSDNQQNSEGSNNGGENNV